MDIKETKDGTIIEVYVKPKSKDFSIELTNDEIIVHCTEPPARGRANREIEKKLSKIFKANVTIIAGCTSQTKRLLIRGLKFEKVKCILSKFEVKKENHSLNDDLKFKAFIVHLIFNGKAEEAINQLSSHYGVPVPRIKVGMPKGHVKNAACYVKKTKTIHFSRRETLANPLIVLHEFYHHLRSTTDWHGGIEKNADKFARSFLEAYKRLLFASRL